MQYSLYIVFSNFSVTDLAKIVDYKVKKQTGVESRMRAVSKIGKKGGLVSDNKTLALLTEQEFEAVDDIYIEKFVVKNKSPKFCKYLVPKEKITTLYLEVPRTYSVPEMEREFKKYMLDKIVKYTIVKEDDFFLTTPLADRIKNEHRGFTFINFKDSVTNEQRVTVRAFLNLATIFPGYYSKCTWNADRD